MTRAYTAWLSVDGAVADIAFTQRPPQGMVSRALWEAVAGGAILPHGSASSSECRRVVRVQHQPAGFKHWFGSTAPIDWLWTIGWNASASCAGTGASELWRSFVTSVARRLRVPRTPAAEERRLRRRCLFLRRAPNDTATFAAGKGTLPSRAARVEANAPEVIEAARLAPLLFGHTVPLRTQVQWARGCAAAVGIHGAQMMNVMWMRRGAPVMCSQASLSAARPPPGALASTPLGSGRGRVYEYDAPRSHFHFYRNVAHLTGHAYRRLLVCDDAARCHARQTAREGIRMDAARLASLLQT